MELGYCYIGMNLSKMDDRCYICEPNKRIITL